MSGRFKVTVLDKVSKRKVVFYAMSGAFYVPVRT